MNQISPDTFGRFLLGLVIATAIALVVFAAISADMLPALVFGIVVLGLIAIALASVGVDLFRRWSEAQWKRDNLKLTHIERMAGMGLLVTGRGVPTYEPMQRQIAAPVQDAPVEKPIDPRREHALRLLSATVESDKYGPKSVKIMTQSDAGAVGIIADDWSAAVAYLFLFGVATGNRGTIIKDDRNVSRLMADVARDKQDNEASAVMGLEEVRR